MEIPDSNAKLRRRFLAAFWKHLRIVWPIVWGLIGIQIALAALVAYLEGWSFGEAMYFTFVTGLTIGYGDIVPTRAAARLIALIIGFIGILLTGLVAALGVRALDESTRINSPMSDKSHKE